MNTVIIYINQGNHLPSLQDGRPYHQNSGQEHHGNQNMFLVMLVAVVAVILLFRRLYHDCRTATDPPVEQETRGGGDRVGQPPRPQQQLESNNDAGGGWVAVDRASASTVAGADVEMAQPVRTTADEPPLVCTYRKADGWREGSCGVCLADLDDGEAVRLLPACMHYFHAACVGEWLHMHATCPLCRAPLVAPADATT